MPHFYFDLVNNERIHDNFGVKLPDVAAARAHAQKIAEQVTRDRKHSAAGLSKIVVKDSKFNVVLSIPLETGQ